jgi:hypothetical protein
MAEDDDNSWTPLIVVGSLFLIFFCCVCCCVAPSRDRSAFAYGWDWISGERSRRKRAVGEAAKGEEQPSAAMLPSLPSLSAVRVDAL